jgi:hypothetical protein
MSHKPARQWTLEFDSNFDNSPPLVSDGPSISGYEAEVRVIEISAVEALKAENEELKSKLADLKKWCPCGGVILADTEDWAVPLCNACYEFVCKEVNASLRESLKLAVEGLRHSISCEVIRELMIRKNKVFICECGLAELLAKIKAGSGE